MSKKPGATPDRFRRFFGLRIAILMLLALGFGFGTPARTPAATGGMVAESEESPSTGAAGEMRVRWGPGLESFGRYTEREGESMLRRIEERLGVEAEGPIDVLWVRGGEAFRQALAEHRADTTGRGFEPWVAGVALYPEGQIILRASSIRLGNYNAVDDLLGHEIAHVVLGRIRHPASVSQPVWLHEGLAQWSAEALVFESPYQLGLAKRTGSLYSFAALESSFPDDAGGAAIAYQQSESMVRFLIDRFGLATLQEILRAMSRGENFYVAFYRLTGVGFYDLEEEWVAYISRFDLWPWLSRNFGSMVFGLALLGGIGLWWKRGRKRAILEEWDREDELLDQELATTGPWSTTQGPNAPSLEDEPRTSRRTWRPGPDPGDEGAR